MATDNLNLDGFNEQDVREELIAPLLRRLGYRKGGVHGIVRELSLRYPHSSLGRKKATDPLLRGKADYICDAGGRVRWVIEAKAPSEPLGDDVIEQAYTYARHPEVRAVYFCVTNGREFIVHRTDHTPDAAPVLSAQLDPAGLQSIENLLSPSAVLRDHPETQVDLGPPLGPGLRSIAQIASGRVTIRHTNLESTHMNGLAHMITHGAVERGDEGKLIAFVDLMAPHQSLEDFARRFGLDRMELVSNSDSLSTNPDAPTIFESSRQLHIPAGERVFNLETWSFVECALPLTGLASTRVEVTLKENQIHGSWSQVIKFSIPGAPDTSVEVLGDFDARVS